MDKSRLIDLKIINQQDALDLFHELVFTEQNKIVNTAFRNVAWIILNQAKSNFNAIKKGKSKTGYKFTRSSFTTAPYRSKEGFGIKAGIKNYKMRWIEWGTDERNTKKRFTGKLQPTNFFFNAVKQKKEEATNKISDAIMNSLQKTVDKYNKK